MERDILNILRGEDPEDTALALYENGKRVFGISFSA